MTRPALVVIRGNSGSGKTTTAREVRARYGRGCALLEQDHLRRIVLREHDWESADPVAPAFIAATARTALDLGYHVVLEGILHSARYGPVLRELIAAHHGPCAVFFLDVSFDETVRRHLRREVPIPVTEADMRGWYAGRDLLGVPGERVVPEHSTQPETVAMILRALTAPPLTPCPVSCPRCAQEGG